MLFPTLAGSLGLDVIPGVSMRHQRFICIRLSNPHMDVINVTPFDHNVHHRGF